MRILVIDDLRTFEVAETHARNYDDGIDQLANNGPWDSLYLDHDLGDGPSGYNVLCWLELHPNFLPGEIVLVTANPVGRDRMRQVIEKLYP